jgi:hypothetical protein
MRIQQLARCVSCAAVWASVLAAAASAQTARPSAGAGGQQADVSATLITAYDEDVPLELRPAIDPTGLESGGLSTMLTSNANYARQGRRLFFSASGSSALRHYARTDEIRAVSHSAGLGASLRLPWRTQIALNQSVGYSPSYLYTVFPRETAAVPGDVPLAPDYATDASASYSAATTATMSRPLGRSAAIDVGGDFNRTTFVWDDHQRAVEAIGFHGNYSRSVSRRLAFVVGYRYRTGQFLCCDPAVSGDVTPDWQTTSEHGLELGMTARRPLSSTRSVHVSFGVGTSTLQALVDNESTLGQTVEDGYRLSGRASLGYQFARGWEVRASFNRGFEYVAELGEPVLLNASFLELAGDIGRRWTLAAAAGYSRGSSGLQRNTLAFDTYTGTSKISYRLNGRFAMYGEYLYYLYDFGSLPAAAGIGPGLERNGVRAGLTVRLPGSGR